MTRLCCSAQITHLGNHLHLIVEADGNEALGRGMQDFGISVAKSLNKLAGREGSVFTERYHLRILRTRQRCAEPAFT